MKKILALDIAGKTGYCMGEDYGTWDFSRKGKISKGFQLLEFHTVLTEYIEQNNPDIVVYEKPGGRFYSGVRSHANFEGILLLVAEQLSIKKVKGYSAPSIKKFATGKGNASKLEVIDGVKLLGYKPKDDNQADAIALHLLTKDELKNGTF